MSIQATLFGKVWKKVTFFKNTGDSEYYTTISCLWQLVTTPNKDASFSQAKDEWISKYASASKAREELFVSAKKCEHCAKSK